MSVSDNPTPQSYKEALSSSQASSWKTAIDEEYQSLIKNGTWILTNPPPGRKVLRSK